MPGRPREDQPIVNLGRGPHERLGSCRRRKISQLPGGAEVVGDRDGLLTDRPELIHH